MTRNLFHEKPSPGIKKETIILCTPHCCFDNVTLDLIINRKLPPAGVPHVSLFNGTNQPVLIKPIFEGYSKFFVHMIDGPGFVKNTIQLHTGLLIEKLT